MEKKLCIIHITDSQESLSGFTSANIAKIRSSCEKWVQLKTNKFPECKLALDISEEVIKEISELSVKYGFHRKCYQKFTNVRYIERCIQKIHKASSYSASESEESEREPTKIPDEHQERLKRSGRFSKDVLPPVCLICGKEDKFYKKQRSTCRDKLVSAETLDGGK